MERNDEEVREAETETEAESAEEGDDLRLFLSHRIQMVDYGKKGKDS